MVEVREMYKLNIGKMHRLRKRREKGITQEKLAEPHKGVTTKHPFPNVESGLE